MKSKTEIKSEAISQIIVVIAIIFIVTVINIKVKMLKEETIQQQQTLQYQIQQGEVIYIPVN